VHNTRFRVTTFQEAPFALQAAFFLGWRDVAEGRPWDKYYDELDTSIQGSYENGRLTAANVVALGWPFQPWLSPRDPISTQAALEMAALAKEKLGDSVPPARNHK
jgi:hypothetical protein